MVLNLYVFQHLIVFGFSSGNTASDPASPTPITDAESNNPPFLYQSTLNLVGMLKLIPPKLKSFVPQEI